MHSALVGESVGTKLENISADSCVYAEGMNEEGAVAGRVKVHVIYDRRSQSLSVMIRHVKDLVRKETCQRESVCVCVCV